MPRYVDMIEDERGDLVDINVYCSADCFRAGTGQSPNGHAWPCPEKADYRQYCPHCERCTVAAIGERSFDGWPEDDIAAPTCDDPRAACPDFEPSPDPGWFMD